MNGQQVSAYRGFVAAAKSFFTGRMRRGLYWARRYVQGPPMLRDRYMELEVDSWAGAMHALDAEGRLFGEEFGMAPGQTELPDTVWRTWKAGGSRHGKLYNMTAMHSVSKHWVHVQSDVRLLQQRFLARFGSSGTLADLYYLGRTASAVPAYLMRRRDNRVRDGQVPARHAAVYKTMAGVHITIDAMIERDEQPDYYEHPEPRQLLEYIEANNLFVASTGHVCSGPEKMVEALFAFALGHPLPADLPAVDPPIFEPDLDRVIDYGIACAKLELAHRIFNVEYRRLVDALDAALAGSAPANDDAAGQPAVGARLAARIFDHLGVPAGTRSGSFCPVRREPEGVQALERCLKADFHLESDGARRAARLFLLTRAQAHRAFCELFESATGALGRRVGSMPHWRMVEDRMSRAKPAPPSPARDLLASLPLTQQGEKLYLKAPSSGLVAIPTAG